MGAGNVTSWTLGVVLATASPQPQAPQPQDSPQSQPQTQPPPPPRASTQPSQPSRPSLQSQPSLPSRDEPGHARSLVDPSCGRCDTSDDAVSDDDRPRLEAGCDRGDGADCFAVATMLFGPPWCCTEFHERDRGRALALFEAACRLGDDRGCYEISAHLPWAGPPELRRRAADACDAGAARACGLLATDFGTDCFGATDFRTCLQEGYRTHQSAAERACRLGDLGACGQAASAILGGLVPGDPQAARRDLDRACEAHRALAAVPSNPGLLSRRQALGSSSACWYLADVAFEGRAGPWQPTRARRLIHEICLVDDLACHDRFLLGGLRSWLWWSLVGLEALSLLALTRALCVAPPRSGRVRRALAATAMLLLPLASVQVVYFLWGLTPLAPIGLVGFVLSVAGARRLWLGGPTLPRAPQV